MLLPFFFLSLELKTFTATRASALILWQQKEAFYFDEYRISKWDESEEAILLSDPCTLLLT